MYNQLNATAEQPTTPSATGHGNYSDGCNTYLVDLTKSDLNLEFGNPILWSSFMKIVCTLWDLIFEIFRCDVGGMFKT